jgi:translation elongation factor EF-Tu-like GTPase
MGWKFWKHDNPMDPQQLLARPHGQQDSVPQQRPQDLTPAGGFVMTVEDVFSITGRGTVVTGRITSGVIHKGDQVTISRAGQQLGTTRITGVEMFRKLMHEAKAGDDVGLRLDGIQRDQVLHGDVLAC